MVLPSGEKATERTQPLCALCFSTLSSKDAAASNGVLRFGLGGGLGELWYLHQTLSVPPLHADTILVPSWL